MILIAGTAADANRADYPSIQLQRDAAGKNHDLAVVGNMNAEELASRLRMLRQLLRFDIKCPRRVSLLHRDIDAADPCVVYTNVRYDVSTFVSHCDVHGLADFRSFLLRRADYAAHLLISLHSWVLLRSGSPPIGFGLFEFRRNSAVVAGNHAPARLGLPRGSRDGGSKNSRRCGTLCRCQQLLLLVRKILREVLGDPFRSHGQKTFGIGADFAAERRRWKRFGDRSHGLALRRRDRSDVNQPDHLWIVSRLRD